MKKNKTVSHRPTHRANLLLLVWLPALSFILSLVTKLSVRCLLFLMLPCLLTGCQLSAEEILVGQIGCSIISFVSFAVVIASTLSVNRKIPPSDDYFENLEPRRLDSQQVQENLLLTPKSQQGEDEREIVG